MVATGAGGRALAEAVLVEVLHAPEGAVRRAVAVGAGRLAAVAHSGPEAAAEISRALLAAAERGLGEVWGRGWQPADRGPGLREAAAGAGGAAAGLRGWWST